MIEIEELNKSYPIGNSSLHVLKGIDLKINEGEPIILICRTGRRTKIIAEMMDKKFNNVIYNAKGGITSWIDKKLKTVKPRY